MKKLESKKLVDKKQLTCDEIQDNLYKRLLQFVSNFEARQIAYTLEASGFGIDCQIYIDYKTEKIVVAYSAAKFEVIPSKIKLFGMATLKRLV